MGPNAVSDPSALMSALQSQQPPSNPSTPAERTNPDQQALEHIKAAQVSLQRAHAYTNDQHMLAVFDVMEGTLKKALLKFDGSEVLQSLVQAVQSLPPMLAAAPGGQQPPMMGGQPGMPGMQPGMGAPPSGPGNPAGPPLS